jgi:hypothetical protein
MPRRLMLYAAIACMLLPGCVSRIFLQSPMHGHSSSYKARPMLTDSLPSATYFSGHVSFGGVNSGHQDVILSGTASIHRAHTFKIWQAYYGANIIAGNYRINPSYDEYQQNPQKGYTSSYDSKHSYSSGNRFFGAAGATGGFNLLIPINNKYEQGEWRAIGAEFNYHREFGDYYPFRKQLSDTVASFVERRDYHFTWSIFSEILVRSRKKHIFGMKIAYVRNGLPIRTDLKKPQDIDYYLVQNDYLRAGYMSTTLHLTRGKRTYSGQLNLGTKLILLQAGLNYRLGK